MFFHGAGMDGSIRFSFQVSAYADQFGFVGVVPVGTPDGGAYGWNVDDAYGSDEVAFSHLVVNEVVAAGSVPSDKPKIVLGFSNGVPHKFERQPERTPIAEDAHTRIQGIPDRNLSDHNLVFKRLDTTVTLSPLTTDVRAARCNTSNLPCWCHCPSCRCLNVCLLGVLRP